MDKDRIIEALKKSAVVTAIATDVVAFFATLIAALVMSNAWWLFLWIPVVAIGAFIHAMFADELFW